MNIKFLSIKYLNIKLQSPAFFFTKTTIFSFPKMSFSNIISLTFISLSSYYVSICPANIIS